jgi:hypothetical protein
MQKADFIKGIKDPKGLSRESVAELQQLVQDFPYFQSAHILLSLASKKWDASVYQQSLKKTAILASNRAHLFDLINEMDSPAAVAVEATGEVEQKATPGSISQKVSVSPEIDELKKVEVAVETAEETERQTLAGEDQLELEIGKQVVNAFVEKELIRTTELEKPRLSREEPESFGDWLNFLKKNNGQSYQDIEEEVHKAKEKKEAAQAQEKVVQKEQTEGRKRKNQAIIDNIIEKNPGLIRSREEQKFYAPDQKAKESLLENEHLVTETLARIYALQGNLNKAIRAYEILSLKYPQKSAYFASLIQKLRNNQ